MDLKDLKVNDYNDVECGLNGMFENIGEYGTRSFSQYTPFNFTFVRLLSSYPCLDPDYSCSSSSFHLVIHAGPMYLILN